MKCARNTFDKATGFEQGLFLFFDATADAVQGEVTSKQAQQDIVPIATKVNKDHGLTPS